MTTSSRGLRQMCIPKSAHAPSLRLTRPNYSRSCARSKSAAHSKSRSGCAKRSAKSSDTASSPAGRRDPAVDLKGALKVAGRQAHHKAMPREHLPKFLQALSTYNGEARTRLALRLATLTFVRATELRGARWEEIDLEAAEWRIPAERMKMRTPHIVPLSWQAVEAFTELRSIAGRSGYVFPSPGAEGFMSNNTMLFAMYRMGFHGRATVHGFRAVASTLLNEMGFNPDWIERQLAHDERNRVRATYNHAQYLPERRKMMQQWADYVDKLAAGAEVIRLDSFS
jgi:integrase